MVNSIKTNRFVPFMQFAIFQPLWKSKNSLNYFQHFIIMDFAAIFMFTTINHTTSTSSSSRVYTDRTLLLRSSVQSTNNNAYSMHHIHAVSFRELLLNIIMVERVHLGFPRILCHTTPHSRTRITFWNCYISMEFPTFMKCDDAFSFEAFTQVLMIYPIQCHIDIGIENNCSCIDDVESFIHWNGNHMLYGIPKSVCVLQYFMCGN